MIYLNEIDMDKPYRVNKMNLPYQIKRRLIDIGLIPGTIIKKVLKNPFGEINAYEIIGSTIAIRDRDAKNIEVSYEEL